VRQKDLPHQEEEVFQLRFWEQQQAQALFLAKEVKFLNG